MKLAPIIKKLQKIIIGKGLNSTLNFLSLSIHIMSDHFCEPVINERYTVWGKHSLEVQNIRTEHGILWRTEKVENNSLDLHPRMSVIRVKIEAVRNFLKKETSE